MKEKISILVIIIIVVIIGLASILVGRVKDENQKQELLQQKEPSSEYASVKKSEYIFYISSYITRYYNTINQNNSSYFGRDEQGNQVKTVDDSKIQSIIYDMLADDYKERNHIEVEDVYKYIPKIEETKLFTPLEMKVKRQGNIEKYIVKGLIQNTQYQNPEEVYLKVDLDTENITFAIEPAEGEYNSLDEIADDIEIEKVEPNDNNEATIEDVTEEYICIQYINMYKRLALTEPEKAYEMLDQDYREKRFENVDNYKLYVEKNRDKIIATRLSQYQVKDNLYVCKDQEENFLIFAADPDDLLNYTLKLDDYTIRSEENQEKYEKATEEEKVALNTQTVIDMINNKDYHNIFKKLDDSYKAQHALTTEESVANLISYYYPDSYTYEPQFLDKQGDVYIQKLTLYNKQKESDKRDFTLMMRLEEGNEYKISITYTYDV